MRYRNAQRISRGTRGEILTFVEHFERVFGRVERLMALVAAFMMFAIMVIVAADVAMRYIFNSPFAWAYDLISLYLMGALFYFALSRAFAEGAHISVDILQYSMSENLRRICQII